MGWLMATRHHKAGPLNQHCSAIQIPPACNQAKTSLFPSKLKRLLATQSEYSLIEQTLSQLDNKVIVLPPSHLSTSTHPCKAELKHPAAPALVTVPPVPSTWQSRGVGAAQITNKQTTTTKKWDSVLEWILEDQVAQVRQTPPFHKRLKPSLVSTITGIADRHKSLK